MFEETNDFTVAYRKGAMLKTVLGMLFVAAMVGCFAWAYSYAPHKTWKGYLILASCPTALFGCLVLVYGALRVMILRQPAITVNQSGIRHVSSIGDTILIPWSKISGFQTREVPGQHSTSMWLDVLPQGSSLKPILSIHTDQLAAQPAQVLLDLKQYRANHAPRTATEPVEEKQPFRFTYRVGVSFGFVFFFLLGLVTTFLPLLQSLSQEQMMPVP